MNDGWRVFSFGYRKGDGFYATTSKITGDKGTVTITWKPDPNDFELMELIDKVKAHVISKQPMVEFPAEMGD